MSDLRNIISQLASQFANGVLEAIRGASLGDILVETRTDARASRAPAERREKTEAATPAKKRGHLGRRSAGDITEVTERIVALLGENPKGLRAEQIRSKLGLDARELPRPIAQALADRKITRAGEKRATTYFAGGAKSAAPAAKADKSKKKALKPMARAGSARPAAAHAAAKSSKGANKASAKVGLSVETKSDGKSAKAKAKAKAAKGKSASKPAIPSIEEAVTIATHGAPENSSD